jgi:prepilin peptidase CpaA
VNSDIHSLAIIAVICAAVFDVRTRKIPNAITFSLILLSFLFYSLELGIKGLIISVSGCATGLGLFLIPFLFGWMGAGDTKLLAAVGAAVGTKGALSIFIITSFAGGLFVLIWFLYRCVRSREIIYGLYAGLYNFEFLPYLKKLFYTPSGNKIKICYGVIIAIGTLTFIFFETMNIDVLKIFT